MTRRAIQAAAALVAVSYPFAAYLTLRDFGARRAALVLLALLLLVAACRLLPAIGRSPGRLRALGPLPLVTAALLAAGAALDAPRFFLAVPAVANLLLLTSFALTLRWGPPMIERFARLIDPDLNAAEMRWCRGWTWIWCAFFALNGTLALLLALVAPVRTWALYNGLLAYCAAGCLVAIEWVLRKRRFGRFGKSWPERLARRLVGNGCQI